MNDGLTSVLNTEYLMLLRSTYHITVNDKFDNICPRPREGRMDATSQ